MNPSTDSTLSQTIIDDSNQWSRCPSSSTTISVLKPTASPRMPSQSALMNCCKSAFSGLIPVQSKVTSARLMGRLRKKHQRQLAFSVSQPPTTGPINGPSRTVRPNTDMPMAIWCRGKRVPMMVCAVGIIAPPANPWPMRPNTMPIKLLDMPQYIENRVNIIATPIRKRRRPNTRVSHAASGIMTISDIRYPVDIQVPSVPDAPICPWICGRAELVMEMSRVASSAPREPAATAIQSVNEALASRGASPADATATASAMAAGVHVDGYREAWHQHAFFRIRHINADAHRHPLHDLGEVAGGVLRRQ